MCAGFEPTPVMPSPNTQRNVSPSPSGSEEPPPSKVTGVFTKAVYGPPAEAVGLRFTFETVIFVLAEPESTLLAWKITSYWSARSSLKVGVQVKVPAEGAALARNIPLFPTGSPERFAVRDVIACPSASDAVRVTLTGLFSRVGTAAATLTFGGRSRAGAQPRLRSRDILPL